jgi:hypothetical protein
MSNIETVKIVVDGHPNNFVIVNKSDLKDTDKIYDEHEKELEVDLSKPLKKDKK